MLKKINLIVMLLVASFAFAQNKNNAKVRPDGGGQEFKVTMDDPKDEKCFKLGIANHHYYIESYGTGQCDQCYDWDIEPLNGAPANGLTFDINPATGEELDMTQQVNINPHAVGDYLVTLTYFDEDGCHTCNGIIKIRPFNPTGSCEYCLIGHRQNGRIASAELMMSSASCVYSIDHIVINAYPVSSVEPANQDFYIFSGAGTTGSNGNMYWVRFNHNALINNIDPAIYITPRNDMETVEVSCTVYFTNGTTNYFHISLNGTDGGWPISASSCTNSDVFNPLGKISDANPKTALSIIPNPSKDGKLTLNFSEELKDNTPVLIIIKDVLGRVQFKSDTTIKEHQVLLNELKLKGKFFIQATAQGKTYTKILLLE